MTLADIYLTTLQRCSPETLVRAHVDPSMPHDVVAIGKCAGAMLDGVAAVHGIAHAFVALPRGYRAPATPAEVHTGGHPHLTRESFDAGRALLRFVDEHDDVLFLISGGGSACVEVPLPPHGEDELMAMNEKLIAGGLPIAQINAERRKLSAIKGGRLAARVRGKAVSLVLSDVSSGRLADVASGPTIPGSDAIVVGDNATLVRAAASLCEDAVVLEEQLECDVAEAAGLLASRARSLKTGQTLVAGGEPTVVVRGDGRGGRCSELAVRFAMEMHDERVSALFAGSDGVDGNSGAAGIFLPHASLRDVDPSAALARSDSFRIAAQIGEPIMIAPTGNNLRDLFLVARD